MFFIGYTGEFEVLVTSLLDEVVYPSDGFLELYGLRWGVESFLWPDQDPPGTGKLHRGRA